VLDAILQMFAHSTGLITNMSKIHFYPIRCVDTNLEFLSNVGRAIFVFPCTSLGLPLNVRKSARSSLQPLVQKIGHMLPGWKRNFLTYPGMELLIKIVLSMMPTHFITIYKQPKWTIA
jgi:hypothetical protein